ncbi:MAG TPA: VOC family protein [Rhizomicrobium sp.]|jgi:catechol 2,3-dioxygenase-like lactoylglutathione lyase family enzyme|nr:VOC family protein [Rhizomicrobium sp.]
MITGLDHVAIMVRDFDATVAGYETIFGRRADWRGFMPGGQHAWFQFANVALDIIGAHGEGPEADAARTETAQFGDAIWGLGFSVPDLAEAMRLYERRGLVFLPRHTTRTKNAAGVERAWELGTMKRKSANGVALFLVENKPDAPRWPVSTATAADDETVGDLDHIVINTDNIERAVALYGGRLGLDLRLDRTNAQWDARQLFFRCGKQVVEIGASLKSPPSEAKDRFGGLAWRVRAPEAAQARIAAAGLDVSEVRKGRKPGTQVFTVRSGTGGVPTLMLSGND